MTMTVQWQQFGVTELEHFVDEANARERFLEVCSDADTTLAWLFEGTEQDAECLDEYVRPLV